MIVKNFKKIVLVFISLILSGVLYAQKDVTQFLGIPIDGSKSEMIQKLKSKGYTNSTVEDVLAGEFNGTEVLINIQTYNNKVWRIIVADAKTENESDIRIRFNNLIQQFQNNKKYISYSDSIILKYTIPEDEDISYELSVHKKQYQAYFFQKTADYDSITLEKDSLLAKQTLNDTDKKQLAMLMNKFERSKNKIVWFKIGELSGKYSIIIFYENEYNSANGEDL